MEMTCPKCQGKMRQYERSGVTVDQCTECRGIFLDRGELERLADAETAWHTAAAPQPPQPQYQQPPQAQYQQPPQAQSRPPQRYRDYDSDEYPMYGHGGHGKRKKKKGSFLSELFE